MKKDYGYGSHETQGENSSTGQVRRSSSPLDPGVSNKIQAKDLVKKMLSEGWAVVFGDVESIEKFEHAVYPPNTPKSVDFRAISLERTSIYLAKKNDDLLKLLHAPSSISEVVGIYISQKRGPSDEKFPVQVHAMAVEPKFIEDFVEEVLFSALNAAPSSFSKYVRNPEKY